MTLNRKFRSERILNEFVSSGQLSPRGKDWLKLALDPFHDSALTPEGYPDPNTSHSIVQCVQQQIPISAPGSGNWDCHLFMTPFGPGLGVAAGFTQPNLVPFLWTPTGKMVTTGVTHTTQLYTMLNILTMPTGTDWWTDTTSAVVTSPAGQMDSKYAVGPWRLVGGGYEVVNTTAELYRNGSVTSYKSPTPPANFTSLFFPSGTTTAWTTAYATIAPPSTVTQAALFPNSQTWSAAQGVYQVFTQTGAENSPRYPLTNGSMMTRGVQYAADPAGTVSYPVLYSRWNFDCMQPIPYDASGTIFSNLTPQTTLLVTVKYFIERFPTDNDGDLLVLGGVSPPYDPLALEIYTQALRNLPVAVPQNDNPLGEWWNDLLTAVADWAAPIGNALGVLFPGVAPVAGNIVGGAASALKALGPAPSNPPRKPQNQRNPPPAQQRQPVGQGRSRNARRRARRRARAGRGVRALPARGMPAGRSRGPIIEDVD